MTELSSSAELIALAQDTLKRYGYGHLADAVEDQSVALEAADQLAEIRGETIRTYERENADWERRVHIAERKAAEYAAVVEKAVGLKLARDKQPHRAWPDLWDKARRILTSASDRNAVLREHDAKVRAEALREAAQEMDEIEANAEIAECAAYVEGETGRQGVIDAAAEMHEDPAQWVRTRAGRIEREAGLK